MPRRATKSNLLLDHLERLLDERAEAEVGFAVGVAVSFGVVLAWLFASQPAGESRPVEREVQQISA